MLLVLSIFASSAIASVIWVGNTVGTCTALDVQSAINLAAQQAGEDEIRITRNAGNGGTWLNTHLAVTSQNLILSGGWTTCGQTTPASGMTTLSGSGGTQTPVLRIRGTGVVSVNGLRFTQGVAAGGEAGGIDFNGSGTLTLRGSKVDANQSVNSYSAGIRFVGAGGQANLVLQDDVEVSANLGRGMTVQGTAKLTMAGKRNFIALNKANGLVVLSPANADISATGLDERGAFYKNDHAAIYAATSSANANSFVRVFSTDPQNPFRMTAGGGPAFEVHSGATTGWVGHMTVCAMNVRVSGHRVMPNYNANGNLVRASGTGAHFNVNTDCGFPAAATACLAQGDSGCNVLEDNVARPTASLIAILSGATADINRLRIRGNTAKSILLSDGMENQGNWSFTPADIKVANTLIDTNNVSTSVLHAREGANLQAGNVTIVANMDMAGGRNLISVIDDSSNGVGNLIVKDSIIAQWNRLVLARRTSNSATRMTKLDQVLALPESQLWLPDRSGIDRIVDGLPEFVDQDDFRLTATSIGVDMATVAAGVDLDGKPRTVENVRSNVLGPRDLGAYEAPADLTIPPDGEILPGPSDNAAADMLYVLGPVPAAAPDIVDGLMLTRIQVVLRRLTTVGQVNAALAQVGGLIVNMRPGDLHLTLKIPRQSDAAALDSVINQLQLSQAFRFVFPMTETQLKILPPSEAGDIAHRSEIDHLLPTRFPAAWNAAQLAVDTCDENQVPVYVFDRFAPEIPPTHARFLEEVIGYDLLYPPGGQDAYLGLNSGIHGYEVATFIAAAFDAKNPTGAMPFPCMQIYGVSVAGMDIAEGTRFLLEKVGSDKAVVNISVGEPWVECTTVCPPHEYSSKGPKLIQKRIVDALQWIKLSTHVRSNVLMAYAAGNERADTAGTIYTGLTDANWTSGLALASTMSGMSLIEWTAWLVGAEQSKWQPQPGQNYPVLVPSNETIQELLAYARDLGININEPMDVRNLLAVGSTTSDTDVEELRESLYSNINADISLPAEELHTISDAHNESGTSLASPQLAGLAAYLWSLSPELRAMESNMTLAAILSNAVVNSNVVTVPDAYATVLSLDKTETVPTFESAKVRLAILDVDNTGQFSDGDLQIYADKLIAHPDGPNADPTYSRHDLNGDGFTGGASTAHFDLDRLASRQFGEASYTFVDQTIEGEKIRFAEQTLTDLQILCYYAYGPMFGGNEEVRRQLLGAPCALAVEDGIQPRWDIYHGVPLDANVAMVLVKDEISSVRRLSFGTPPALSARESLAIAGLGGGRITSMEGSLTTDPARRNHVVISYEKPSANGGNDIYTTRLNPQTQQWEQAELVASNRPGAHFALGTKALIDEHGNVVVRWYEEGTASDGSFRRELFVRVRNANSGQWEPLLHLSAGTLPLANGTPAFIELRNGRMLVAWSEYSPQDGTRIYTRRYLAASGWADAQLHPAGENLMGAGIGASGSAMLMTEERGFADSSIRVRHADPVTGIWGAPREVERTTGVNYPGYGLTMHPDGRAMAFVTVTHRGLPRPPHFGALGLTSTHAYTFDPQTNAWSMRIVGGPTPTSSSQINSLPGMSSAGRFMFSFASQFGYRQNVNTDLNWSHNKATCSVFDFPLDASTDTCVMEFDRELSGSRFCRTFGLMMPGGNSFLLVDQVHHGGLAPDRIASRDRIFRSN